jgi:hypothetical protein
MRIRRLIVPASALTVACFTAGVVLAVVTGGPDQRSLTLAAARDAAAQGFEEQRLALSDGVVTKTEYRGSLGDLTACLSRGGLTFDAPVLSPVDGFSYIIDVAPPDAQQAAALSACTERYWGLVSTLFESSQRQVMDPKLLAASSECLASAGFAVTGAETNFPDLVADNRDVKRREAAAQCVLDEGHRLFPQLQTLSVFA